MLRRVTPTSACVFIALSQSSRVTLTVFREEPAGSQNYVAIGDVTRDTIALGSRLHVLGITAPVPNAQKMVPGEIYSYDLAFDLGAGQPPTTLHRDQFLSAGNSIGYGGRLPSFALPPSLSKLKLVHGSCRKAGGEGQDMLPLLDRLIAANHLDPFERPHQLLLTGDQIYADDVPACLLTTLRDTAAQLLAWSEPETITWDGGVLLADDPRLRTGPAREEYEERHEPCNPSTTASRHAGRGFQTRMEFMFSQTDFSSLESDAHLIFLGEFYAQYLMAWSPELWPRSEDPNFVDPLHPAADEADNPLPYDVATYTETVRDLLSTTNRRHVKRQLKYREAVKATRREARRFAKQLPAVRRALANIPSYMIMDDHEITDDWNLDWAWHQAVLANSAGRHIVRNGLIAYAVFQDWGNQPDRYDHGPGQQLLDGIKTGATQVPDIVTNPQALNDILRLHTASPVDPQATMLWDHVATGSEHQVLFMDTRTWRHLPAHSNGKAPAGLINSDSLERQFSSPRLDRNLLTFVISPGPVFGLRRVEFGQSLKVIISGAEEADRETWEGQESARDHLYRRLLDHSPAILLSGDVHYAFVKHAGFRRWSTPRRSGRLVQLNCSSLRNEIGGTRALDGELRPMPCSKTFEHTASPDPFELGRALEVHFEAAAAAAAINPAANQEYVDSLYATLADIRVQNSLKQQPALDEDLVGPEYEQARLLMEQYSPGMPSMWNYHLNGVNERLGLAILDPHTLQRDPGRSVNLQDMARAAGRQPYVVGRNNIALVTLRLAPPPSTSPVEVVQTLFWWEPFLEDSHALLSYAAAAPLAPPQF
jgi:hypothetical protein